MAREIKHGRPRGHPISKREREQNRKNPPKIVLVLYGSDSSTPFDELYEALTRRSERGDFRIENPRLANGTSESPYDLREGVDRKAGMMVDVYIIDPQGTLGRIVGLCRSNYWQVSKEGSERVI